MSSVVTFWYDVYSKPTHLDEVTIGIKKDYTPHYLHTHIKTLIMNMETLKLYCEEMISSFPQHKEEIVDYLQLAIDEIEQGASEPNEINLCVGAIEEMCVPYMEDY